MSSALEEHLGGTQLNCGHRQVSLLLGLLAVGDERPSAVVRRTVQLRNSTGLNQMADGLQALQEFPEADCSLSQCTSSQVHCLRPPKSLLSPAQRTLG